MRPAARSRPGVHHHAGQERVAVLRPPEMKRHLLFIVEGFTDIRFVVGLASICNLTMVVPAGQYRSSGLKQRVTESGAPVTVYEIPGGRLGFQTRAFAYLWKASKTFDCILAH